MQHLRFDIRLFLTDLRQACHKKGAEKSAPFCVVPQMPYVQSTALARISYDDAAHTLRATFRESGRTYVYEDVPQELYDGLIFSDSIGAYFNAHIRDRFAFHEIRERSSGTA